MSSDRLKELQHQRALAQEQLAWLDGEIAREAARLPAGIPSPALPNPVPLPASAPEVAPPAATDQLARLTEEPAGVMAKDAKRGCLIAFVVGMVVFFALVAGAYALYLHFRAAPL